MSELYIGLMSGTSVDGINAAVVNFGENPPKLVHHYYYKFSSDLRQTILRLCQPAPNEIKRMGDLDILLGKLFADTIHTLLEQSQISAKQIRAIGSHGQTIRHHPNHQFTLQIGDPNIIAAETGITTITDFRRRDIAHGGQGAPLAPAFHEAVFAKAEHHRAIVNIGGIANITLLPAARQTILGFDTGPGNTLLDAWIEKHLQQPYDQEGAWARQGSIHKPLLEKLLADRFFHLPAPKSTGREYFNLGWLENYLPPSVSPVNVQATLVALTAESIMANIKNYFKQGEIFICGGGVHNKLLMEYLKINATPLSVHSTQELGIDPDWVEAMAFAWLAKQTLAGQPGNITTVTGAKQSAILGGIYQA
ncbi:MAG: anhydro-N-acetylmuramic acid kinase [Gammaproteobacteria bacterium]|jgi:anhydro-N-acetylmuramic acid kinase|nr:anhydro-N-acetylmuramic acid kinase [Gammaproteobacteria bacterium]